MAEAEAKPPIMPWEENFELKPVQAVAPADSMVEKAIGAVSKAVEGVKDGKMPWELNWTEKPRTTFKKPVQADVRKSEPAAVDSFISKMEAVESGGNADAANPNSSATGLHQFTASTWKSTVAEMGKDYTLADRKDPIKSREVVRFFTQKNANAAEADLGRKPTEVDLYMYHFLGKGAAGDFLKAPRDADATDYVSTKAALSNKTIFYKGSKPKTVGEVIDNFRKKF